MLAPTMAVAEPPGASETGWQIPVRVEAPGVDPDRRGALPGWEATPHQRFERLLRETNVPTGLLLTDRELRLVHAPRARPAAGCPCRCAPLAPSPGAPCSAG